MPFLSKHSKVFLVSALAISCLTAGFSLCYWQRYTGVAPELRVSRDIIEHTTLLLAALNDAETGQRLYLLTGQEEALEPCLRGRGRAVAEFAALQLAAGSSFEQQRLRVGAIGPALNAQMDVLRATVEMGKRFGLDGARKAFRAHVGDQDLGRIGTLCELISSSEKTRLIEIRSAAERQQRQGTAITSGGSIFTLVLLVLAAWGVRMADRQRDQLTADLGQSNKLLRRQALFLDMANDTIFVRDGQDRITYWNRGAERLYGWSREEALGQATHELFNTRFPEPLERIMEQLRKTGGWKGELVHTRRDGALVHVGSSWTLQHDPESETVSIVEMSFDITDRKKAEQELENSRGRLDAILNSSLDGIIVFEAIRDEAGTIRDFSFASLNAAAEQMLELPAASIIGQRLLEKYPAVASGLFEKYCVVVDEGTPVEIEYLNPTVERTLWYRIAAVRLGDGLVVNYYEITRRKESEHQLRTLATRLAVATGALEAGIWDWDLRTNEVVWDERMHAMYGLSKNSRVDYQVWADMVIPEDIPGVEAMTRSVITARSQASVEFRVTLPNGSLRHIAGVGAVILDEGGEVARIIGVNIDVTERKLKEALERELSAQLKSANAELAAFAYVASHDLKSPLRVIDNASRWLEEDLDEHLTGEHRENMNLLRGRVKRMDKLLDDLMEYARIGKGSSGRHAEIVTGDVLMDNVLMFLTLDGFSVDVSAKFAGIRVRLMPLQQILINLIGNARKHHHQKNGRIEVTVEDAGDYYAFAVKDDGPGIQARFHSKIFEMFTTLKPRDQMEGSGMGLAMVRKNVRIFGGVLELESAEGKGSTFRFTWPKEQKIRESPGEALLPTTKEVWQKH
jgi:PAS domain S-box-containing protein